MSAQDKRQRSVRVANKSPIATPPRVALSGRSSRPDTQADIQSSESSPDLTSEAKPVPNREQVDHGGHEADEKLTRIACLEKEMAIMEEEFSRELGQLGEKYTNESDTSKHWQQKYSALNQQFLKTDADLRILRYEMASLEKQREERDKDVKTRISSLMLDRDTSRESYHLLKSDVKHKEEEISRLRIQVKGLKDFLNSNSRTDDQVTDEVVGEMMQRLGNGIQNWVIQNFRKAKIDIAKSKEETREQMTLLVPTYESQIASSKVHLIQSLVSRLLVIAIFGNYFVGLPQERATELRNYEQYLLSITKDDGKVNQWRSTTLGLIRGFVDQLRLSTDAIVESIVRKINTIMENISDAESSETRDQALRALINKAIDLSRLLRVQKAIFKTVMPVIEGHQVNRFDAEIMEDIGGEDEDSLEGREISCVTFPGMIKEGNESGEQTQLRNVITKARVLCTID